MQQGDPVYLSKISIPISKFNCIFRESFYTGEQFRKKKVTSKFVKLICVSRRLL